MIRLPSASMTISLVALAVSLGGVVTMASGNLSVSPVISSATAAVANTATDPTLARRKIVNFNLAAGAISAPIALPDTGHPILLLGFSGNGPGGIAALVRISPQGLLSWITVPNGFDYGRTNARGTPILNTDRDRNLVSRGVIVEVFDGNAIQLHNTWDSTKQGSIVLLY